MHLFVHGGAGRKPENPRSRGRALEAAVDDGLARRRPLDAVVAAIRALEADPQFNAGRGSVPQSDGIPRTDAGVMTEDLAVGAVSGLRGVEATIEVARLVMVETPHVLVGGDRGVDLAGSHGIPTDVTLLSASDRRQLERDDVPVDAGVHRQLDWVREWFDGPPDDDASDHDTVGAVAGSGDRMAAGTSTGGRRYALAGRIGDVPQVGAGFLCTNAGAVSTTGAGEEIARMSLARQVMDGLTEGRAPDRAAQDAVDALESVTGGSAGVIAVDDRGRIGAAHTTEAMQTRSGSR